MKALLNFIFGKSPDIFDKDGTVRHNLPQAKWEKWNARYQQGAEFNWRNHTGMRSGDGSRKETSKN